MTSAYPTTLDNYTTASPLGTDPLNSPSHSGLHREAEDALNKLEAKAGVTGSVVTTSLDYILNHHTHVTELALSGTQQIEVRGDGELTVGSYYVGSATLGDVQSPKASFTVLTGYVMDQQTSLGVGGWNLARIEGTGELRITDDSAQRSSIVLAGRGN